jgi:xylulose-5-phosphate/fructose-6-phosphate phosphoketolase
LSTNVQGGRLNAARFHVRGFNEQGTTTPFDMVVLNGMSRYRLAVEALHRSRRQPDGAARLEECCRAMLARHHDYVRAHLEDLPEIPDWTWADN